MTKQSTLQLTRELGRCAKLYLKNGSAVHFKPMEHDMLQDTITGTDEEGFRRTIRIHDIDAVIYFRNINWRW